MATATLTTEQIEQKKQQFLRPCGSKRPKVERKQLAEEVKALTDELAENGAIKLSDDDLDNAAGGLRIPPVITT